MTEFVLDSSAFLALLLGEPGQEIVRPHLSKAVISSVNYAEVLRRATKLTGSVDTALYQVDRQRVPVVDFNAEQARVSATLVASTPPFGLSLSDRVCLSLAMVRKCPVLTADRAWGKLDLAISITLIR
ncbi:MAG: type II toxin-antitoxin system VapC family toxin [Fimbriiglobus sp.]